ncbi:MAG: hypothetical protein KME27_10840 [Lyngbya sp. HA4199-MV5]|jgi:hypothetical protein|nr:hypothetical protein [Lyngbya sp. HA4199-MV5]
MAKRKHNPEAAAAKKQWSKGLGTTSDQRPLSFKFPPTIDALLRAMGTAKADYVRSAVEAKLREDGLL